MKTEREQHLDNVLRGLARQQLDMITYLDIIGRHLLMHLKEHEAATACREPVKNDEEISGDPGFHGRQNEGPDCRLPCASCSRSDEDNCDPCGPPAWERWAEFSPAPDCVCGE